MNVLRNGKVRRNAAEWQGVFRRFDRSGLSAPAFCRHESINLTSFRRWQKRLGIGVEAGGSALPAEAFVEVTTADGSLGGWLLEIELPEGRMLRMRG